MRGIRTHIERDASHFVPETFQHRRFPELEMFVKHRTDYYKKVKEHADSGLLTLTDTPKVFVLKLLNRREIKSLPPFLRKLQREVSLIQGLFNDVNTEPLEMDPTKEQKVPTFLCRWIDTLEVRVLETVIAHVQQQQLTRSQHCISLHDGLLIEKDNKIGTQELQNLSDVVFEATGFRYSYKLYFAEWG